MLLRFIEKFAEVIDLPPYGLLIRTCQARVQMGISEEQARTGVPFKQEMEAGQDVTSAEIGVDSAAALQ